MIITLIRTKAEKYTTRGEIHFDGSVYYTLEPPVITKAKPDEAYAIAPGKYRIEVKNNPIAGTPAIKVFGDYILSTTAIRCCKPVGRKNNSITIVSNPESTGDAKSLDYLAWTILLLKIRQAMMNKEEVVLEIVEEF